MPLTVTTFNIQTFGGKRSAQQDRLEQVAASILLMNPAPDIVGLVEITERDPKKACDILDSLCGMISNPPGYTQLTGRDFKYIITPYDKFETYVFLYDPNTVNPVVFDVDYENYDSYQYCTADLNQPGAYPMLSTLKFSEKTDVNSYVRKKRTIDGMKTCIYNAFPLLHFNGRSTCRPPGLGLFTDGINCFGILIWHNMSGDDSPSYTYMHNLGSSALVANNSFNVNVDNNLIAVGNLLVTGDFNVDYLEAQSQNFNPYATFTNNGMTVAVTNNNALSYLNYYRTDWKYPDEEPVCTKAFDNTFYRFANFTFNNALINDYPGIFMNSKPYLLRFFKASRFISGEEDFDPDPGKKAEVGLHPFGRYLSSKMARYKLNQKQRFNALERWLVVNEFMAQRKLFRANKTPKLEGSRQVLGNLFDQFYADAYKIYVAPMEFRATRYIQLKDYGGNVKEGDTVFFLRQFISDHLPVTIVFT